MFITAQAMFSPPLFSIELQSASSPPDFIPHSSISVITGIRQRPGCAKQCWCEEVGPAVGVCPQALPVTAPHLLLSPVSSISNSTSLFPSILQA